MLNPGYRLDQQGIVLERIMGDTPMYVYDVTADMSCTREGQYFSTTAELLIPDTVTLELALRSGAFVTGAALVIDAFSESSVPGGVNERVRKRLAIQGAPINLLHNEPAETEAAFSREADKGLRSHPEINEHLQYLMRYYVDLTQDESFGKIARIGAGFAASRLDTAYNAIMDHETSKWVGVDIAQIDWDAEMRGLL